jgi:Protein of unknown function (DUF3738)
MKTENDADFIKAHLNPRSVGRILIHDGHYGAWGNSSEDIASVLQQYLRREVIDKTGLTGRYDFSLTWTPWQSSPATSPGGSEAAVAGTAPVTAASGPSIFTAVKEQLGLKLKPARAPVEVLVVDHNCATDAELASRRQCRTRSDLCREVETGRVYTSKIGGRQDGAVNVEAKRQLGYEYEAELAGIRPYVGRGSESKVGTASGAGHAVRTLILSASSPTRSQVARSPWLSSLTAAMSGQTFI